MDTAVVWVTFYITSWFQSSWFQDIKMTLRRCRCFRPQEDAIGKHREVTSFSFSFGLLKKRHEDLAWLLCLIPRAECARWPFSYPMRDNSAAPTDPSSALPHWDLPHPLGNTSAYETLTAVVLHNSNPATPWHRQAFSITPHGCLHVRVNDWALTHWRAGLCPHLLCSREREAI